MTELRVVQEFRGELLAAAPRRRRRPSRGAVIAATAAVVAGCGVAAAATGTFPIGKPIKPRPANRTGPAAEQPVRGSGQVAAIRTADPDGGPPWGVREFRTATGRSCLQAGRVVNGRLGLIGDDGAFHEVPLATFVCEGGTPTSPRASDGIRSSGGGGAPATASGTGSYSAHPCYDHISVRTSFDPRTVVCDERDPRWIFTGTTGPNVVAVVLRGSGVDERYPVVDGRFLIVRRGDQPAGVVVYSVFRDGRERRESSTPHARPRPLPPDPRLIRRVRLRAKPRRVDPHGLVTVTLRAPAPAEPRSGDWYDVVLRGPPGCVRQGVVRFTVATPRHGAAGAPVKFGIRPPGPSLEARGEWCAGTYHGTATFRSRIPVGGFAFAVR